jgi:DNA-3-methyladenine glycosylase II
LRELKFNARALLPVRAPYRLDLTVDALRRLASNVVDVVGDDGTYYRALRDVRGTALIAVRQPKASAIELRVTGRDAQRWAPAVARILGTQIDLRTWYQRSERIGWLQRLADALKGLKPPRYASAWEACAHAIVFQQISIHAAAAIMRRAIERLGETLAAPGVRCIAFPGPQRWLEASDADLRSAGLSANKAAHLRSVATAFAERSIDEASLEVLSTHEAAEALCAIRGIGPWSAAVVLLRGFGRLDTFPMRDSGVARAVTLLSGDERTDLDGVLEILGPTRGMLYYHLLLGRLRNLVPS